MNTKRQFKLFQLGSLCILLSFIAAVMLPTSSEPALNVTGTFIIELQFDDLPRFNRKSQIELHSIGHELAGLYNPQDELRFSYWMIGRAIAPSRVEFTLPISMTYVKGATFPKEVDYVWITFVGDVIRERNDCLSLVGSYTRFDRDREYPPTGQLEKRTGTWRADRVSTDAKGLDSAKCMLFHKHIEGTKFREDPASPTGFYIPENLEDALNQLDRALPTAAKEDVRRMSESEVWMLRQNFEPVLRSFWGLDWGSEPSKLAQCIDSKYPYGEGAVRDILEKYWLRSVAEVDLMR